MPFWKNYYSGDKDKQIEQARAQHAAATAKLRSVLQRDFDEAHRIDFHNLRSMQQGESMQFGGMTFFPTLVNNEQVAAVVVIPAGTDIDIHRHDCDEHVYVISGTALIETPSAAHTLKAGQSISFPAEQPHRASHPSMAVYFVRWNKI